jgi:hypothetical protein
MTLTDLYADYGSEEVLWIDIIAGYSSDSPSSYSYLDGITINFSNGDAADINLEAVAVPVPGALLMAGLGVSVVGHLRRKRSL